MRMRGSAMQLLRNQFGSLASSSNNTLLVPRHTSFNSANRGNSSYTFSVSLLSTE